MSAYERIARVRQAIECLEVATRAWRTLEPTVATVDPVVAQADAVARALRELRQALHADRLASQAAA